jgi:hypothetical protein
MKTKRSAAQADRSVDAGDLAAGAFSQPQQVAAAGGPYQCSIHPVMVGGVNQDAAAPAPCMVDGLFGS